MRAAAICFLLLAIVLPSCGGHRSAAPAPTATKRTSIPAAVSWKDRMSTACSDLGAAVDELPLSSAPDGLKRYLEDVLALELAFDQRVSGIRPSSMETEALQKAARARREWESSLARLLRDVKRHDQAAALSEARAAEALAHEANASLEGLGLTQCLLPFTGIPG
jgi:hypothetical protein